MNLLIVSTLVLLAIGSLDCYPQQRPQQQQQQRIPPQNIINMPYSVRQRSFNQPQQPAQQCGPVQCQNGGQCQFNPYNSQSSCACRSPYYGSQCEFFQPQAGGVQPSRQQQSNNLCRVFNERNMNICQNGGQCVFVADGKVACICPTTHKGLFCELPIYLPCNGDPAKTCHRDHGVCDREGNCVCDDGYTGPRCDKVIACSTGYCLNDAECEESEEEPYRRCTCKQNYFGRRCEKFGIDFGNGTVKTYERSCNLTIRVANAGGYIARFYVDYDDILTGQRAKVTSSNFAAGSSATLTVPFYAENLAIVMQTTFNEVVHIDRSLPNNLPCRKCYKIWGVLGMVAGKWDYTDC